MVEAKYKQFKVMNRNELVRKAISKLKQTESPFLCVGTCYYYKRLCIDTKKGFNNVFDTSTDIWRPLNTGELEILCTKGWKACNDILVMNSTLKQYSINRHDFHIATIKGNQKEKQQYFDKAIEAVKKLKTILGY